MPARRRRPGAQTGHGAAADGCVTGKRGYATEAEAQEVLLAARVDAALRPDSTPRREQRCSYCRCENWHLTRQKATQS